MNRLASATGFLLQVVQEAMPGEIRQVALDYDLMSSFTAFIAMDSSHTTEGDHGMTVSVPVPVRDGARYETTVQNSVLVLR